MEEASSNLTSRVVNFLRANILISALFFLGVILLVVGLIQFMARSNSAGNSIQFESAKDVKAAETSSSTEKIMVDVSGEVNNPGVYEFTSDARVSDAIKKAGGVSSSADTEYVSKNLNLAQKLADGMKIYIPAVGEEASLVSNSNIGIPANQSGLTSINNGSESELESLPGVGPVTAGKIINGRPYISINELLEKKVVGKSIFEKIKDSITL